MPLNYPPITIHLNPEKFNLDSSGFTFIVKPADIVEMLLDLKPHQLRKILHHIGVPPSAVTSVTDFRRKIE